MEKNIIIRRLYASDLKFILTLFNKQVFRIIRFLFSYTLNLLLRLLRLDILLGSVAQVNNGNIVGAFITRGFPLGKTWVIGPVAVHSNHRQLGIATRMMNFVMGLLEKKKVKGAILALEKDNLPARRFFEKWGFVYLEPIFTNRREARNYNQKFALVYGYFRDFSSKISQCSLQRNDDFLKPGTKKVRMYYVMFKEL